MLRIISFSTDYCFKQKQVKKKRKKEIINPTASSSVPAEAASPTSSQAASKPTDKEYYSDLQSRSHEVHEYSFLNYLCYVLYLPLYTAGPIISFNAFLHQVKKGQTQYSYLQILIKTGWLWVIMLAMQILLRYIYFYAFFVNGYWGEFFPFIVLIA